VSLTYSTLKSAVLSKAHRSDLTTEVVGFIREAEGMIRRELRAYELRTTLDDSDRVADGLYNLPSTLLEVRNLSTDTVPSLENVGPTAIKALSASADVVRYAILGNQIEFRGVPGTGAEIDLLYFGWPDELSGDSDTNELLELHEAIYIDGALSALYEHTQDTELADRARGRFDDAVEKLNQQHGRKIGGASVQGAYNFGHKRTSSGY
jgi:hypothetical protein